LYAFDRSRQDAERRSLERLCAATAELIERSEEEVAWAEAEWRKQRTELERAAVEREAAMLEWRRGNPRTPEEGGGGGGGAVLGAAGAAGMEANPQQQSADEARTRRSA
jgi:hypothetical protein